MLCCGTNEIRLLYLAPSRPSPHLVLALFLATTPEGKRGLELWVTLPPLLRPEGPFPSFLLERTQDGGANPESPACTLVDPELMGGGLSPEAQPVLESLRAPQKRGVWAGRGMRKTPLKKS